MLIKRTFKLICYAKQKVIAIKRAVTEISVEVSSLMDNEHEQHELI